MHICLISDFFYPRLGGVELHQYQLAQGLIRRGHKVIVITGTYGDKNVRQGIRYMSSGLKVYYCPQMSFYNQATLPTLFTFAPLFRQILLRERIQVVHGHQATSSLAHECILHARTMGYRAVYTDHSLFGFADLASIHINKVLRFTLADINHVICVSHCQKENLVLRARVDPAIVSVIPNAVDTTKFTPDPSASPDYRKRLNIVILSRLVYRKGIDLAVQVIPVICARFPHVHFIVGGDGGKRLLVEEMREKYALQDRVEVLGAIAHTDVRNVLIQGHIFLNFSLTEAFCIAILEAVSCGLFVVATKVGGVPEILPPDMIVFAEPRVEDLIKATSQAVLLYKPGRGGVDPPALLHARVKEMYSWHSVAERTEIVYEQILRQPNEPLLARLNRFYACGPWAGKLFVLIVLLDYLLWVVLDYWMPVDEKDVAVDFPNLSSSHRATPFGHQNDGSDHDEGKTTVDRVGEDIRA